MNYGKSRFSVNEHRNKYRLTKLQHYAIKNEYERESSNVSKNELFSRWEFKVDNEQGTWF